MQLALFSHMRSRHLLVDALGLLSLVLVLCFEYRVVFVSLSRYLYYESSSPSLSHLLVTLTLLTGWLLCALAFVASRSPSQRSSSSFSRLVRVLVLVCLVCGGLTIGIPAWLFPVLFVSVVPISSFLLFQSMWSYLLLMPPVFLLIVWFLHHSLYFLQVTFVSFVSIRTLVYMLVALVFLILIIPPFFLSKSSAPQLTGFILCEYSLLLVFVEFTLVQANTTYHHSVYPSYLVFISSFIALLLTLRLHGAARVASWSRTLCVAWLVAKLFIVFVDEFKDVALLMMLLSSLTPVFISYDLDSPMTPWQGVFHAVSILISLFLCRNTIIPHLLHAVGVSSDSSSTFFSAFLIAFAAAMAPFTYRHFPQLVYLRRFHSVFTCLSLLSAFLLQPTTMLHSVSSPIHLIQDTSYIPVWPYWLLFAAISLLMLTVSNIIQLPRSLVAFITGISTGLFVAFVFLPVNVTLCVVVVSTSLLASIVLAYLFWPSVNTTTTLTASYAVLVAVLPVSVGVTTLLFNDVPRIKQRALVHFTQQTVLVLHASIHFIIALAVKTIRFRTPEDDKYQKLKAAVYNYAARRSLVLPVHNVESLIGNLSCLLAFLLSSVLLSNISVDRLNDLVVLALCPLLLLLNGPAADSSNSSLSSSRVSSFVSPTWWFGWLSASRRYYPVVFVGVVWLVLRALWSSSSTLLSVLLMRQRSSTSPAWLLWYLFVDLLSLLSTLPILAHFLHITWSLHRTIVIDKLVWAPLSLFGVVFGGNRAIQLLGGGGILAGIYLFAAAKKSKRKAMQII